VSEPSSARSYHYHPDAGPELYEDVERLRAEDQKVAEAFEAEISKAIERLLQFPEIGPVAGKRGDLVVRKLKLHTFRYSVVYAVIADEIRIYAIAHHSRMPFYWLDRV
jgi:plasmid stabilization system protein ParE